MPFDNPITIPEAEVVTDDVLGLLIEGRAKIARGWCQKDVAQDQYGDKYGQPYARFCSYGALIYSMNDSAGVRDLRLRSHVGVAAMHYLTRAVPVFSGGFISYSDAGGRTHAEVLAMWDRAIERRRRDLLPPERPSVRGFFRFLFGRAFA